MAMKPNLYEGSRLAPRAELWPSSVKTHSRSSASNRPLPERVYVHDNRRSPLWFFRGQLYEQLSRGKILFPLWRVCHMAGSPPPHTLRTHPTATISRHPIGSTTCRMRRRLPVTQSGTLCTTVPGSSTTGSTMSGAPRTDPACTSAVLPDPRLLTMKVGLQGRRAYYNALAFFRAISPASEQ